MDNTMGFMTSWTHSMWKVKVVERSKTHKEMCRLAKTRIRIH